MSYMFDPNINTTYTITSPSISTSASNLTFDYSSINWATTSSSQNLNGNTLEVQGDANFHGDLKIQGKSIVESLEQIEEKLAILRPNLELEEKWEQLRGLRKAYMELEAEIKEKERMWNILKK